MNNKRKFFSSALGAALSTAFIGSAFGGPKTQRRSSGPHSTDGGLPLAARLVRANYGLIEQGRPRDPRDVPMCNIPQAGILYMLPMAMTRFAESADFTLGADGCITINQDGLYRVSVCVDWPGQQFVDIGLRYFGAGRLLNGEVLRGKKEGELTNVDKDSFDRLAVVDIPGSDSPLHARLAVNWIPGAIGPQESVSLDIRLPLGFVNEGDVVQVAHTALTDDLIGAWANNSIRLSARMVAPDTARVFVDNAHKTSTVNVPAGTLRVLAGSSTLYNGRSADAWSVVQSPTVKLLAGEKIFGIFKSLTPGDYVQASQQTYLQIERWG